MVRATKTQAVLGFTVALSCGLALATKGIEWYISPYESTEGTNTASRCKKTRKERSNDSVHYESDANAEFDNPTETSSRLVIFGNRDGLLRNGVTPIGRVEDIYMASEEDSIEKCVKRRYHCVSSESSFVSFKKLPKYTIPEGNAFERVKTRLDFDFSDIQHVPQDENLLSDGDPSAQICNFSHSLETEEKSPQPIVAAKIAQLDPQPDMMKSDMVTSVACSGPEPSLSVRPIPGENNSVTSTRSSEILSSYNNLMTKSPHSTITVESRKDVEQEKEEIETEPSQLPHDWDQIWKIIEDRTQTVRKDERLRNTRSCAQSLSGQTDPGSESTVGEKASKSTSPATLKGSKRKQRRRPQGDEWIEYNRAVARRILNSTLRELDTDRADCEE